MKKLVYISSIASPHQIKLCEALNKFYITQFWFYDYIGKRSSWWKIPLNANSKILEKVLFKKSSRFVTLSHLKLLNKFDPDIVVLGGFSIPANYFAYLWARFNKKKTVVFTERSRNKDGDLRKRGIVWSIIRYLYRNIDLIMTSEEDIVPQFRDELRFGDKVVGSRYATDINSYLNHPIRNKKDEYTILFANRLTDLYNPIEALEIFKILSVKYPKLNLLMNALGELRKECNEFIRNNNLKVEFLDNIPSWDKLHEVYAKSDILLFPAKFSNGNFTIIESMASGMGIVISNNIHGVGTYIKNNENGFNLPLERDLFIQAISQYIQKPSLLKEHGQKNKASVKHLGPEGTAKLFHSQIEAMYKP